MPVEMLEVKMSVPKELNDLRVALVELVRDIKAGKDLATLSAENLGNVMSAVGGIEKVPDAVREELGKSMALGGLFAGELLSVFVAEK